jgi:hypothetical protein
MNPKTIKVMIEINFRFICSVILKNELDKQEKDFKNT